MSLENNIKQQSLQCVKCGLCLPHCPTYIKTQDEGDSPRGRISLMQGLVEGQLQLSDRLEYHLDRCLTCRACEAVCPSEVRYGQLIDNTRHFIEEQRTRSVYQRLFRYLALDGLISHTSLIRVVAGLLRLYQRSGLQRLARQSGLLHMFGVQRLEKMLPGIPSIKPLKNYYPAVQKQAGQKKTGEVALFSGCLGSVFDSDALHAAIHLLTHCGYGVHVPRDQGCCGALHLHEGRAHQAQQLANRNLEAFNTLDMEALLFTASGCGAVLSEYSLLEKKNIFNAPVMDISHFLASVQWPGDMVFTPLEKEVMVHNPCSLTNVLHSQQHPYSLLENIPDIRLSALPGNRQCCGAAGSYMLKQAAMSDELRDDKLSPLKKAHAAILVTSNFGCGMHLKTGLDKDDKIEIMHPVTLLAKQLVTTA